MELISGPIGTLEFGRKSGRRRANTKMTTENKLRAMIEEFGFDEVYLMFRELAKEFGWRIRREDY